MNNYAPRERIPVEDEELRRLNQHWTAAQSRAAVQSRPLDNGRTTGEAVVTSARRWPLGIVLLTFGLLWWLPAARTTVDGWVLIINTVGSFFSIPGVLARLAGWPLFAAAILIGLIYSRVETHELPIRRIRGVLTFGAPMVWVGWLFLAATDVGSTFLGVMSPPPGAWLVHTQVAANPPLAFVVALLSTFAPDWVIIAGLRRFK
jgi:hypothetical protein